MGKRYAVIYKMKKCSKLFIGRLMKEFLDDENRKVQAIEMRPKVRRNPQPPS